MILIQTVVDMSVHNVRINWGSILERLEGASIDIEMHYANYFVGSAGLTSRLEPMNFDIEKLV